MANSSICSVEGCNKPARTRDWCSMHYARWLIHGDLHWKGKPRPKTDLQRFLENAVQYEGDDCLYWPNQTKSRRASTYVNGRLEKAARYVCRMAHGEPPAPEYEAAHSCGHGWEVCLNQRHLRWATRSQNQMDRVDHGTSNRGQRNSQAVLTVEQVREIKRLLRSGEKQKFIAAQFGVSRTTILAINLRKSWAWL